MNDKEIRIVSSSSKNEEQNNRDLFGLFKSSPIPENELLNNLGLFSSRQALSRIIFMNELYKKNLNTHGVIFEFGVRWGQNLSLFSAFRGMYEPYNYNRKIVGFDTFSGFPEIDPNDGRVNKQGDYAVTAGYEDYLEQLLRIHENESPIAHIKKFELIKGDATIKIDEYLKDHPETIISLAYFDFDIYIPTKKCLESILPFLTRGSVLAFDELNYDTFPGETVAVREVLGLDKYRIQRSPLSPLCSYIIIE